jgi:hypothetical protein
VVPGFSPVNETSPPAAPEPPAFPGVPADVASVGEKTVAVVLANGETYEEVIRKKQGGAQLFAQQEGQVRLTSPMRVGE